MLTQLGLALLFAANIGCANYYTTGYTSQEFPGRTFDGTLTIGNEWSLVSTDPNVIPLQSSVWIDGEPEWQNTVFRAADTGGGIKGYKIDVLVRTLREAYSITGYRQACHWGG